MADSNITKRALSFALKELMEELPFSKISITDICEKCDMNRKSFYYHFRDKYDLVNWTFDTEFIAAASKKEFTSVWDVFEALAEYLYSNKTFYRKAFQVNDQNSFSNHLKDMLIPIITARMGIAPDSKNKHSFSVSFVTDAIIMALQNWLTDKNCIPPEEFLSEIRLCLKYLTNKA